MTNPAHTAALEYIKGRNARLEAVKISDAQIGQKFGYSAPTIGKVWRGIKTEVPDEDRELILALKAEQQRLRNIHRESRLNIVAHRHQVRQSEVKRELQKLGVNVQ